MPDDLDLRDLHERHEPDAAFRLELRRQVAAIVRADAAPTTTTDLHDQEDLLMLTDTHTEPPATRPRARRWLLPAAAAVIVALVAAVALTSGDDGEGENTTANSSVVFHDDFSDDSGAWETSIGDIRVEGGHQVWTIGTPGQVQFLKPKISEQRLLNMEVTAEVASVDPDSTIGIYCRKGVGNQDYYYFFRLLPAGAVIGVLAPVAEGDGLLAEAPEVTRPDGPFELAARCVDEAGVAQLTMLIDGEVVLEATHDEPLEAGFGAVEVQAGGPGTAPSEVRWDEFTVAAR